MPWALLCSGTGSRSDPQRWFFHSITATERSKGNKEKNKILPKKKKERKKAEGIKCVILIHSGREESMKQCVFSSLILRLCTTSEGSPHFSVPSHSSHCTNTTSSPWAFWFLWLSQGSLWTESQLFQAWFSNWTTSLFFLARFPAIFLVV